MNEEQKKSIMTKEERLALANKLDKELDEFIENLPKRKLEEGPPDENWLEELSNHPFFLNKSPEPGDKLHPLYEGLQQLKYDPNENTPEELALSYKEDGNFNFKHKNYRLAIIAYTEAIKVKCGIADIEASLLNNRSAANWFLKNYHSCLRDCILALKLNPNYEKVIVRAANACYAMRQYERSIEFCEKILVNQPERKDMLELSKKCVRAMKEQNRDMRKREAAKKRKKAEEELLLKEIQKRRIQFSEKIGLNLEILKPRFQELSDHPVSLNGEMRLVWPAVFMYPEYQVMDFVQQFCEDNTFHEQISNVLEERPNWDKSGVYVPDKINAYYENEEKTKVHRVDLHKTLHDVLKSDSFVIRSGTPSFILLIKDSAMEKEFLSKY